MHVARNLIAKVSQLDQEAVKKDYWAILNGIEAPPGEAATSIAHQRADLFAEKWGQPYPRAVDCLLENLTALTAYLHFPSPPSTGERVRHSNLLERTFGESRRRVKVIGRLPGDDSCMSLIWAVLDRASVGWRGLETSVAGIRRLQDLRRQLLGPPQLQATGRNGSRPRFGAGGSREGLGLARPHRLPTRCCGRTGRAASCPTPST